MGVSDACHDFDLQILMLVILSLMLSSYQTLYSLTWQSKHQRRMAIPWNIPDEFESYIWK